MGAGSSRQALKSKHILWCDTEGGIRNVPLWDVSIINESRESVTAHRFCSVAQATKRGKKILAKALPIEPYMECRKDGGTCMVQYEMKEQKWEIKSCTIMTLPLQAVLKTYLQQYKGSVLTAWNLKGHDRHVLARAVGQDTIQPFVLWDSLPWFRSKYTLPKNTMASAKAGTPRGVFQVPVHGAAHDSLADAAHMRDVVCRAASCLKDDATPICLAAYKGMSRKEQFAAVRREVEIAVAADEWHDVVDKAWTDGMIPPAVYKAAGVAAPRCDEQACSC